MDDKYFKSPLMGGIPEEVPIYLEILVQLDGMEFKMEDLEKFLTGMTDKSLAQTVYEWGRSRGIIEEDTVRRTYTVRLDLAYGDVESHPEYFD